MKVPAIKMGWSMNKALIDEHLRVAREAAARSRTLFSGVLVFAAVLTLTVFTQSFQNRTLETELALLRSALSHDFGDLSAFYRQVDGPDSFLYDYADRESNEWSQLCFLLIWDTLSLNDRVPAPNNEKITRTLETFKYVCNQLHDYNDDIQQVAYYQRKGVPFEALPKEALLSLAAVLHFDADSDRFLEAMEVVRKMSIVVQEVYTKDQKTMPPRVAEVLAFGQAEEFTPVTTEVLLRNLRSGAGGLVKAQVAEMTARKISELPLGSLGAAAAKLDELERRQAEVLEGTSVTLPVVGIQISYSVFWLAGAIVNALFLAVILRTFETGAQGFAGHAKASGERNEALFRVMARGFAGAPQARRLSLIWNGAALLSPTLVSVFLVFAEGTAPRSRVALVLALAAANALLARRVLARGSILVA